MTADTVGGVRTEDAFDVDRMTAWLRSEAPGEDLPDGVPAVRQFGGGVSNLTYLLELPGRSFVLRRPPSGTKARGAHDVAREFELQRLLGAAFPQVPRMVALCRDESVIGSPFYVMEHVQGVILRREIPADLGLASPGIRQVCEAAIDTWIRLHDVDVAQAGLAGFGRGPGHIARQVSGWSGRYERAHTPDVGTFQDVMRWLATEQPPDAPHVLVHNDFRFDNLVLDEHDPASVRAVLDWELASVGDPWLDLGSSLAYWVQADDDATFLRFRQQPTHTPGMLTRWEVVTRYGQARGLHMTPERWAFYEVFGLFRLAVIAQQIHYRHFHGQTTNPAFAHFGQVVEYLEARCLRLIGAHG